MPIYMDYHIFPGVTVEEVKAAHMSDKATQDRYGVKYHQFWVNKKTGSVFCLIEGPNPEACVKVHEEAHGAIACNIIEVQPGMLNLFMGENLPVNHGIVYDKNGEIDSGYRFIMVLDIVVNTSLNSHSDLNKFIFPEVPRKQAQKLINKFKGELVENLSDDSLISVFKDSESALKCTLEIQKIFNRNLGVKDWNITYKMGLNEGQPVTMSDGFFKDSIVYTKQLSLIANKSQIVISQGFKKLCSFQLIKFDQNKIKVLNERQKSFIGNFWRYTESNPTTEKLSIEAISQDIGLSRPQLYRKIKSLTGRSPLNFIRDLKMRTAFNLIKDNNLNVSEVAYKVGYDDPSYFSKCFSQKFGICPSKLV
ncbi:nickel-binding protein [Gramella sp. AN32]|uniref:Nickel-binding protein n=1 Tax=Christiangramia antarctica TaxID=2058158 RepID=A0ABW5X9E3_9FLAO|nr:nickel-binding protein [Gramella sp. AN32]MCM4155339.1 DUF4242 domain-containing protein [Gramella sp. AN32]